MKTDKLCAKCGDVFIRLCKNQKFCSWQCRFKSIVEVIKPSENGCIEWTKSVGSHGYGQFAVRTGWPQTVHRLSWIMNSGPIPNDLRVLHKCDNRRCINVEHLFLGTDADNVKDMIAKGRQQNYEWIRNAKRSKNGRLQARQ